MCIKIKMNPPYTYASGMKLTALKDITKGDMVILCKELNKIHADSGLRFEPEPITEGGIVYIFPNNSTIPRDKYKTIRMNFIYPLIKYKRSFIRFCDIDSYKVSKRHLKKLGLDHLIEKKDKFDWPCVPVNVMELWENNNEVILESGLSLDTCLKAFRGAPVFTENELKVFGEASEKIGLKVDSKIPKDDYLISTHGELG